MGALPDRTVRPVKIDWRMKKIIYSPINYATLCKLLDDMKCDEETRLYAIDRWFNWKVSLVCKDLFIKFGDVMSEQKSTGRLNCSINGIAFDILVSI